jgi:HK97 gp10 family phage protein
MPLSDKATPVISSWSPVRGSFKHIINNQFFNMRVEGMDKAFRLLTNIGLASNGLTNEEANKLGARIIEIASEDLNSREYHMEEYTRDTGYHHMPLARTLKYEVHNGELKISAGDPKGGAPHAAFLEYGTSRHPPYPYMAPAIAEAMSENKQHIANRIKQGVLPSVVAPTQISRMATEELGLSGLLAIASVAMTASAGVMGMVI